MMKNTGSCLCGKITFSVDDILPTVGHCHCNMCQKFHGAAFSTFVEVKRHQLTWLSGEKLLTAYQADNETVRQFCQCCGSSLTFESKYNREYNTLELALAVFDYFSHQENIQPDAHIYMASKVNWITINDDLPKYINYRENK
jgi:hypothetical protein